LSRLHTMIDQVVESFISGQMRQLDAVAAELAAQQEQLTSQERNFADLSDSIAGFVEEEATRLQNLGFDLLNVEDDARHEAYDASLPGPKALHRINRLWRKAIQAFESERDATRVEMASTLEAQKKDFDEKLAMLEQSCKLQLSERDIVEADLKAQLQATKLSGEERATIEASLSAQVKELHKKLEKSTADLSEMASKYSHLEELQHRVEYEREAEREEFSRHQHELKERSADLERQLEASLENEKDLQQKCSDRSEKLSQMKHLMDEQECEMTQKIERVQQYVKERQTAALQAEKKLLDAEKMAERWQCEVRRLQAEKDKLAKLILDLESRQCGQIDHFQSYQERHRQEVASLQEALRRKEEEWREANLELLQRRDEEYQAKVSMEKQREKERSIALLKKKEQEVHIKEQQLKAARQRIQELEGSGCDGGLLTTSTTSPNTSRGSSLSGRRPSSGSRTPETGLPPLPLSAR
jgi:myosin heavy subunit